ncbi:DUF4124 domain-containing protein [Pleionea litopenaei]|uniref:DUF4124 domain-containing protein n=1 Tax=Pleionea litopenaei TaxID=3070815 RepID=A0AA51RVE4_9GAMM|nr:DUF4124 domain-containing protein [Pleionea sp. HL-JVS1]WMS88368.1 DUF4124 domain-containing protein [Pleionea sp. HL-JVS1]
MIKTWLLTSIAVFGLSVFAASGVLYKWKDADGNIKYGDRPPKGVPYERIKVRDSKGNAPTPITEKMEAKEQDNSNVREQLDKAQQQMNQACKIAKANMKTLETATRIKITGEDGEARQMTEEEREKKKAEMQEKIKQFCEESNDAKKK